MSRLSTPLATWILVAVVTAILWVAGTNRPATALSQNAATPGGAELYDLQCSSCHGPDAAGVGGRGPSLLTEGEAAVDFVLRTGRMPLADPDQEAKRGPVRFSEAEIVALIDYIGSLGTGPPIPELPPEETADVVNGGELYRLNCAACHVASGSGAIIGGGRRAPNLMDATRIQIAEAMVVGPGAMPVFDEYDESEIADVAAYVLELQEEGTTDADALGGIGPVAEGLAAWLLALVPLIALTRWIGHDRSASHSEVVPTEAVPESTKQEKQ